MLIACDRLSLRVVLPMAVELRPRNGDSRLSTLTLEGVVFAACACAPPIEATLARAKTEID